MNPPTKFRQKAPWKRGPVASEVELRADEIFEVLAASPMLGKKAAFEAVVGEPLQWEKLENKRACRAAVYAKAQSLKDADSPALLDWAAKKAFDLHRALGPEFPSG